jgi:DNA-binding NarL/FixJ family response regulator
MLDNDIDWKSLTLVGDRRETAWPAGSGRSRPDPTDHISVMVVDAQLLVRAGVASLLNEDDRLEVVALSEGGRQVAETCATLCIDVVVTDLVHPSVDGIELVRMITATSPGTRVLILTSTADWRVVPAMAAGASGYLLKCAEPEAVRSAVVSVHRNQQVLCPEAAQWFIGDGPAGLRLTRREEAVLGMVGKGAGNKEIAELLDIGEKTVRNYVSRLYQKLAVHNRAQMATYAAHGDYADSPVVAHPAPPAVCGRSGDRGTP